MTSLENPNKALALRFFEQAVNWHNADIVNELMAPDAIDHNPGPSDAPGRQGIREVFYMLYTAFPDLQGEIEDVLCDEERVVLRWTIRGTNTCKCMGICPTERAMTATGIDILRFQNGIITERWGNSDDMHILEQLEIVPRLPATASW
jgi:predicted ester cyclase